MTLPRYAPNYKQCGVAELKKFIEDRTGKAVKRRLLKKACIDKLQQLDTNAIFDFLGLPPELRSLVYHELLILRPNAKRPHWERTCWPQILATSKGVHAEAVDVLYSHNDYGLTITSLFCDDVAPPRRFRGQYDVHVLDDQCDPKFCWAVSIDDSLSTIDFTLPEWLRSVRRLRVTMELEIDPSSNGKPPTKDMFAMAHYYLYDISSRLAAGSKVRSLTLEIKADGISQFNECSQAFLWPLTKIPSPPQTVISGLSKDTMRHLRKQMKLAQKSETNTYLKARKLLDEAKTISQSMQDLGIVYRREELDQQAFALKSVLAMEGYVDKFRDVWLGRAVEVFDKFFTGDFIHYVERETMRKASSVDRSTDKIMTIAESRNPLP